LISERLPDPSLLETVRQRRLQVLGTPVDDMTMGEALACVQTLIEQGGPHQLTPINANKLWQMAHDPDLDDIVRSSSLILPEWAVVWASGVLGRRLRGHIGGVMLLRAFLPVAAQRGYRLFFLGARQSVVKTLAERVAAEFPGLQVAGFHHGYVTAADDRQLVHRIRAARADFLAVAMGTPRQELWIARHKHDLAVPVCIGVGGSFDVLAGLKADAPAWARGHGLEWLYRLMLDPRNLWKRYLVTNPWLAYRVARARFLGRGQ
jgi:N-acetylglucosaminyldiphosphoundecaprenol N-acetyl-beta-D-mannosaminyltransferase